MAFTKSYRDHFARGLAQRYKAYWHQMHPRIFKQSDLYQQAFTKREWKALCLLRERRKEVIDTGATWWYSMDLSDMHDRPEDVPKKPQLGFDCKKGWPSIEVPEGDFSPETQTMLRDWTLIAYQYKRDSEILERKLKNLVKLEHSHFDYEDRNIRTAAVNTPGQLFRIWPELLPFLDGSDRDVLRNKKVKSPLPKSWDESDLESFHYGPAMERLSYALTVMSLIPDKTDKKYPELT